jgi:hypothetical protein
MSPSAQYSQEAGTQRKTSPGFSQPVYWALVLDGQNGRAPNGALYATLRIWSAILSRMIASETYWFERSGCCAIAAVQIVVRARHAAVTHDGVYANADKLTAL